MLLPSQQLRDLAATFDICLSGKEAPAGCDVRYRQLYWLMVFDQQGELRSACKLGEQLGVVTKQGFDVPNAFVEIVEQGQGSKTTLEGLKRAYLESRGSEAAFEALRNKLDELQGVGQMGIATFLHKAATKTEDPVMSRARSLLIEAHACSHQVINHGAFAHLQKGLANFIGQHPSHAFTPKLLQPLLNVGLKYSFDIEVKCRSYAEQWTSGEGRTAHGDLVAALNQQLAVKLQEAMKQLAELEPTAYARPRLLALVGDAKQLLQVMETTKTFGVFRAIHAEWRREAEAKQRAATDK